MNRSILSIAVLLTLPACGGSGNQDVENAAPIIVSIAQSGFTNLDVTFSTEVARPSAEAVANYALSPARPQGQAVLSATRLTETVVRLVLAEVILPLEYTVTVNDVENSQGTPIEEDSLVSFVGSGKVAFLSSASGTGNLSSWEDSDGLSGLAAADRVCRAEADRAGFSGDFMAWLSDSTTDAASRVGLDSGPWIRTDGLAFTTHLVPLLLSDEPLIPLTILADGTAFSFPAFEAGAPLDTEALMVWTGTQADGKGAAENCRDWTSADGAHDAQTGMIGGTTMVWTEIMPGPCSGTHPLYCFQTGEGPAVPAFEVSGKRVFVTSEFGSGNLSTWDSASGLTGLGAADSVCTTAADRAGLDNASTFKAWLSDETTDAAARLVSDGPWVSMSGVLIAGSKDDLLDETLFSGISADERGRVVMNPLSLEAKVWTGTLPSGAKDAGSTCDSWTNATDVFMGSQGVMASANLTWTTGPTDDCDRYFRLYCFEDE